MYQVDGGIVSGAQAHQPYVLHFARLHCSMPAHVRPHALTNKCASPFFKDKAAHHSTARPLPEHPRKAAPPEKPKDVVDEEDPSGSGSATWETAPKKCQTTCSYVSPFHPRRLVRLFSLLECDRSKI